MAEDSTNSNADTESEVWGAIAAFEQILEAMPTDMASLAALAHAYSQIGDHSRATEYFVRLGEVLISENDSDAAVQLLEKLEPYSDDERVRDLMARIATMGEATSPVEGLSPDPGVAESSPPPSPHVDVAALSQFKVSEELSLAWSLMESGEMTQDEYASVVQDLTEMSAAGDNATVSVLHVLEARNFKGFDRVLGFLARETSTPFISLGSYDFQFPVTSVLPAGFCMRRGAYAFEAVGKDLLVAILNPQDAQLRIDIELIAARPCHFYIALPSEFDQAITRYRETEEHGDDEGE